MFCLIMSCLYSFFGALLLSSDALFTFLSGSRCLFSLRFFRFFIPYLFGFLPLSLSASAPVPHSPPPRPTPSPSTGSGADYLLTVWTGAATPSQCLDPLSMSVCWREVQQKKKASSLLSPLSPSPLSSLGSAGAAL